MIVLKAYKDYGTTLFESLAAVPSFLTDGEVLGAALQDIAISESGSTTAESHAFDGG